MRFIRLNNGTVYTVDRCGASGNMLSLRLITDTLLVNLCVEFGVPENVERIEHWFEGTETDHIIYEGYTQLVAASKSDDDAKMITLMKG